MSIADLFESGERKRQKGHFRNLVFLAHADGVVTEKENELLVKIGSRMGLTEAQIEEIKSNPEKYPVNPPINREDRIRRLVQLVEMVCADGKIDQEELNVVNRFGMSIGCTEKNLENLLRVSVRGIENGLETSEIVDEILGE